MKLIFHGLRVFLAIIVIASALAPGWQDEQTAEAQETGPVGVTTTPRTAHSVGSEQVGGSDAHIITIDAPAAAAADYKYQFLQNGVRLLINRQDGQGWQPLVSQIRTAPEYEKRQGGPSSCVWNPYGLNVNTGGGSVLQGLDRQNQSDGSIKLVRTYATSEEGIAETLTETWTIPATTEELATSGPKVTYAMTQNRGIVPDGNCQEGKWRMRWEISGIVSITSDALDIRDSENWPIRRKSYNNGEFTVDVNDFDNQQATIQHRFSEIASNNKAEILFHPNGITGNRIIDPAVVTSNITSAWEHNKQRNVFYNGSNYFVFYDKGSTSIFAKGASTIAGLASASEQTIINGLKNASSLWDIYVVNDTKFDLIYQPADDQMKVQTCTVSGTTIDCTTISASATATITNFNLGNHTCVVRTPSANRIWVRVNGLASTLLAADQAGDSGSITSWTSKTTTSANRGRCAMVPYGSSDSVLYLWQHDAGGTTSDKLVGTYKTIGDTGGDVNIAIGANEYTLSTALGNLVRISDTDFRTVYIDAVSDVIEAKFDGTSWTNNATVHAGTDKNPSLFYNRLGGDLYALYADLNDDIWYHKKASGGAWGTQTNADADEADANSLPVTQMHEPPTGSSRTNSNIRFPWCYRNANSTNYDVVCEAVDLSSASGPTFTLNDYRWYVDPDTENVTDPWGVPDIAENTALTPLPAGNNPPGSTQELRLRVNFTVNTVNLSTTDQQFTLQYKAGTDGNCTTGSWTDVGIGGGAGIWRFATSSVTDGADLSVLKLAASDVLEEYVKSNPSPVNHNTATAGQDIEYDFHIEHNGAVDATQYSFRVVESDSTIFDAYTTCPTLTTEPSISNLMRFGNLFSGGSELGFFWAN